LGSLFVRSAVMRHFGGSRLIVLRRHRTQYVLITVGGIQDKLEDKSRSILLYCMYYLLPKKSNIHEALPDHSRILNCPFGERFTSDFFSKRSGSGLTAGTVLFCTVTAVQSPYSDFSRCARKWPIYSGIKNTNLFKLFLSAPLISCGGHQ
jgi:hypothetical protein